MYRSYRYSPHFKFSLSRFRFYILITHDNVKDDDDNEEEEEDNDDVCNVAIV